MTFSFASKKDIADWNNRLLANPDQGNIFQTVQFANQKKHTGWTPRYIANALVSVTVLEKTVPGLGAVWYLPKAPGVSSPEQLGAILPELRKFAKHNGVFVVKIEPEILNTAEAKAALAKMQLRTVSPIQPNFSTVLVDLSLDAKTVLSKLHQKGRHAIRRAERDGAKVKQVPETDENCQLMYQLLSDTAKESFSIRSYEYYKSFWQSLSNDNMGALFFAYVDEQIVAGAYALILGKKSTYKDGASIRERTVYGVSHLLQWQVMLWAKSRGALTHDLCGAPPSNDINNTDHPHYGIGRFKTSFNKHVTDYIGAYDVVVRPLRYAAWQKIGERAAQKIHRRRHGESYY